LFQTNKASTRFLQDGRAILRGLTNPDFSSVVHELAHVARRHVLDGDDLKTVEDWAGVKNGVWEVKHEERFAKAFEIYILKGKAPSSTLVTAFNKMKQWMKQIYKTVADVGLDVKMTDDVRAVFDRMLVEDTKPVTAQRDLIKSLREQRAAIGPVGDDPSKKLEKAQLTDRIREEQNHLAVLKESSFTPGQPSPAEIRYRTAAILPNIPDPTTFKEMRGWRWWWPAFKKAVAYQGAPLMDHKSGRMYMQLTDNATETRKSLSGELDLEFRDIMTDMGPFQKEAHWFTEPDDGGFSNSQRLIEEVGVPKDRQIKPTNENQVRVKGFVKRIMDFMTEKAVEEAILRKMPSKDLRKLKRSKDERLPRMMMEDAWRAIEIGAGPDYNDIVTTALFWNPELKDFNGASRAVAATFGGDTTKRVGILENSRAIKIMPDHVRRGAKVVDGKLVGGEWKPIFHSEPYQMLSHMIDQQAMRIARVKEFGQGTMRNLKSRLDKKTGELVGNRGPLRALLGALDQDIKPFSKENLINKLIEQKGIIPSGGETLNQIRAVAKQYDIATSPDYLELLGRVMLLREADVTKRQLNRVRRLARKWKGIDTKQPVPELLNSIKERLTTDIEDNLLAKLREQYGKEGGDVTHFDNVDKVWQGLPYGWLPRNPITRTMRLYGDILGTMHTSLAVIRNIGQTGTQVPQLGGIVNFLKAMPDILLDYKSARDAAIAVGAMRPVMYSWRSETGYGMEVFGKNVRQAAGKVTGLQRVAELNETVAATVGKHLAEDWRNNGFGQADIGQAINLRLSKEEIDGLLKRQPMSDRTYRKIIQTMVAETQYTTQAGHRKALLENIPLAKSILSYQSYTYGATRNCLELVEECKNALASREPARIAAAGIRVATLVSMSVGIGTLGLMAVGLIKGQPPRKEEQSWWDYVLGGFVETQLAGIGSRLIDPFEYSNQNAERWIIGFMPQLRSVASLMEATLGWGKYGRFDMRRRWAEGFKQNTPVWKAVVNWTERVGHPDLQEYQKSRILVSEWKKSNFPDLGKTYSNEPMNPEYYDIHQAIARNDSDSAIVLARAYYKNSRESGMPVGIARRNLRQSLMSRRPIDLSIKNAMEFSRSLPIERRQQVYAVQRKYIKLLNKVAPVAGD
jgi:hypothetical protein